MPSYVQKYRCPDCGQAFKWPARQAPPDFCPACGSWVGETPDEGPFVPKAPLVVTKPHSLDKVYRQMEEGSIQRSQAAAEMLGVSESDVSAMKITDMKDRPREGENSFVTRPNPVSTFIQQVPTGNVGMVGPNGAAYASAAHSGPYPHAGAYAARTVNQWHSSAAAQDFLLSGRTGR